jgi:hypothetical protein
MEQSAARTTMLNHSMNFPHSPYPTKREMLNAVA